MSRRRLAIVVSHPIAYFVPIYRLLAKEVDLTVFYCSREGLDVRYDSDYQREYRWDIDLLSGYRSEFLPAVGTPRLDRFLGLVNPAIASRLRPADFDLAVVHGWATASMAIAAAVATIRRLPFVLSGDTADIYTTSATRRAMKQVVLRGLFRCASGALYCGGLNRDFYRRYGMNEDQLFFAPWSVDNERFTPDPDPALAEIERTETRRRIGVPDDAVVVLFSGKLIDRKRPLDLIAAVGRLRARTGRDVEVVIAGDGPLRGATEAAAAEAAVPTRILGYCNQSEMPAIYRAADVFCLPSERDPRGTVTNEAMASGLPIVVTRGVGIWGEGDILRDGETGYVVDVGDVDALADRIGRLVEPSHRRTASRAALRTISQWSHREYVDGVLAAMASTSRG